MLMVQKFQAFLEKSDLSENTVASYVWTVNHFLSNYGEINKENLLAYKGFLMEHFRPQTVNLRLQGINKYLEFIRKDKLKLKFIKVQQKNFLENVISDADYRFLKRKLKSDGLMEWYFVVWFMGATGAKAGKSGAYTFRRSYVKKQPSGLPKSLLRLDTFSKTAMEMSFPPVGLPSS